MFKGWNSHVHRGLPGRFESSNVSRDNVSREIRRRGAASLDWELLWLGRAGPRARRPEEKVPRKGTTGVSTNGVTAFVVFV